MISHNCVFVDDVGVFLRFIDVGRGFIVRVCLSVFQCYNTYLEVDPRTDTKHNWLRREMTLSESILQ